MLLMEHLREDCAHNQQMLALVRPTDWSLVPADVYDLVAIGGGTAGMVASAGAAVLGARSAMIERSLMGGDCLVTGCVPSKALIRAAHAAHEARAASRFGIETTVKVDFGKVMDRLRKVRADVAHDDSAQRFADRGVEVLFGHAKFTGPNTLELDGRPIRFKRAVIGTGARPFVPPIPGIDEVGALTSDSLFELEKAPGRLLVLGGGPIGCEIGQAMSRLGCHVTIVEMQESLLPLDDPRAGAVVADAFSEEGIEVRVGAKCVGMRRDGDIVVVELEGSEDVRCDKVVVAVGRRPNTEGLGLEAAGVDFDRRGVTVDKYHRTSNKRIYAAGDICSPLKFTHAAYAQAEYAVFNTLFPVWFNARDRVMPRVTYTDPEVAHVGPSHSELQAMGDAIYTVEVAAAEIDRFKLDGHTRGFCRVHLKRGSDRIIAATIVSDDAGELIAELGLAITKGLGLTAIGDTIHAYPTRSELVRKVADAYNFSRVTPRVRWWLAWWLRLLR
jgi:pyruvate/2-oxoglutarate dehydrogenase complex dihydrolipoamide dehydrogenase (E3) component